MNFKEKVYKICSSIPKGKVVTYGQLARLTGKPKAARAIGVFMKNNPD
ncbi:MAG TPA: cysteine methyltransferase, partial [Candidatus Moranbacteria bacterium]|nr:cysteine methyltransferase [Candidatus Moranbacteria bacterium]